MILSHTRSISSHLIYLQHIINFQYITSSRKHKTQTSVSASNQLAANRPTYFHNQSSDSHTAMGLIKTAMMSGAAIYGVNKLAKSYDSRQANRPMQQQQQQQQMQPQRQSRDYSPNATQGMNSADYNDNRNQSPQPLNPSQQQRSIDPSTSYPQEYWYLNNNNEWARVPSEYANMRTTNPEYERQAPQYPLARQQQLEFDYPRQQQQGYVYEEVMEPRSRSLVGPDQLQQGLSFLMNASSKGGKKGKDGDKMSEMMSMFSR